MISNIKLLERVIFGGLREKRKWSSVRGHVASVHFRKWLAVFVFMPVVDVNNGDFLKVVKATNKLVNSIPKFKGQICRHEGSIIVTSDEFDYINHCYTFWLPVARARVKQDFKKFFLKRSSHAGPI